MRRPKQTPAEQGANTEFLASTYSNQELLFLIEHFGEPPEVAMPEDVDLPKGVNPAALMPILDQTYRLALIEKQLREKSGDDTMVIWCGFDALRAICEATLDWNATVADLKKRVAGSDGPIKRAAGAPSLHMWDPDTDIPYLGGIGADSEFVRTALEGSKRVPLYTMLRQTGLGAIKEMAGIAGVLKAKAGKVKAAKNLLAETPNALEYDHGTTTSVVRCPICGYTEVFETTKPSTKRKAEVAMRKHLDSAKVKKDQHHVLSLRLKSGKAGTGQSMEEVIAEQVDEELVDA